MYSVILLAAMTSPADTPAVGRLFGKGCHGCTGYTGCVGSCTGCRGSCVGSHAIAPIAPIAPVVAAPYAAAPIGYSCGGCGGCSGKFLGYRNGCWSTGGFKTSYGCHGAGSCYGHAYAGINYGFAGCYGSCYGSYTNYFSYWAGPIDVHYGYGMPIRMVPNMAPPVPAGSGTPPRPVTPPPPKPGAPATPKKTNDFTAAPASVIVTLPADARLFANGQLTQQTQAVRHFMTPELEDEMVYHYIFTAEITRNDRTMTETIAVEVRAGEESRVSFDRLIAATPAEPTRIASK